MNLEDRRKVVHHLTIKVENLEIHHQRRDGDWLKPEDLREILRLMYFLITDVPDAMEDIPSD